MAGDQDHCARCERRNSEDVRIEDQQEHLEGLPIQAVTEIASGEPRHFRPAQWFVGGGGGGGSFGHGVLITPQPGNG
jgi:hypothetical protein